METYNMAIPLDQQIQTKMDAYRNNPRKLQQRYQQSQQLLDLLALQKLKSEKEAAARDMQMKMQMNPNTIKQQRERELLDMTKKELIDQTGGIMALNKARQQSNLKKAMSRPQGVTGRPAPNMMKLANGGIVGYASAGEISAKIAELRQKLIDGDITPAEYKEQAKEIRFGEDGGPTGPIAKQTAAKSDDLFLKTITTPQDPKNVTSIAKNVVYGQEPPNTIPKNVSSILEKDAGMTMSGVYGPGEAGTLVPQQDRLGPYSYDEMDKSGLNMIDKDGSLKSAFEAEEPAPKSGIGTIDPKSILGGLGKKDKDGGLGGLEYQTIDYKPIAGDIQERVNKLKKEYGPIIDKEAVGSRAKADYMYKTKDIIPEREKILDEKASGIESLIADKQRFYDKEQDPDKLAREKLRAALIGAGGKATFGGVGRGIMQGVAGAEAKQQEFRVKGFNDLFGDKKSLIKEIGKDKVANLDKSLEIINKGFDIGLKKEGNQAIENAAKMNVLSGLDKEALAAISKDNENFLKANIANASMAQKANIAHMNTMIKIADINMRGEIANLQASISKEKNAILEEANKLKDVTNKTQIASTLFAKIEGIKAKMVENLTKTYQKKILDAQMQDPKNKDAIEKKLIAQMNAIIQGNTAHLDSMTEFVMKQLQNLGQGAGTSSQFKVLGKKRP